jgi:hypothetical protein
VPHRFGSHAGLVGHEEDGSSLFHDGFFRGLFGGAA